MNSSSEFIATLQYRLKAATAEVMAFRSGEKFIKMQEDQTKERHFLERIIRQLKKELAVSRAQLITNRNHWFEVYEDVEKEYQQKLEISRRFNKKLEERALRAERLLAEEKARNAQLRHQNYEIASELEEEKGKNLKLHAQMNRDYENSSLPSSKSVKARKITNNREKTGRKPGAQPGHTGHCRKKQIPTTEPVLLAPPQEVLADPDFKKTSKTIIKQVIKLHLSIDVTEYRAEVYYNSKTGERIHAAFPEGVVNDVNYDGSVKAFLFLLNNECCTSIDKSRKFLSDLTNGTLNISKGMINQLSKEFSEKTQAERKTMFAEMQLSPVMHTDCTNAKVNGKSAYVFVCAAPDGKAMYFARRKKGHEGVKGTPVEDYQGTIIQDHEATFYNYGSNHQECLAHVLRYLKDSIQNEPDRNWNKEMRSLVQEMIHYRKGLPDGVHCTADKISEFESRYKEILKKAEDEYEYIPPNKYYKDGYNLYARMKKYMSNHLLFLHDHRVPTTNNEAERLLRSYKRKQVQAVSFRSQESIEYLCDCMSMLIMMRRNEENNLFDRISRVFG